MRRDVKIIFVFESRLLMSILPIRFATVGSMATMNRVARHAFSNGRGSFGRRSMVNFHGNTNVFSHRRTMRNRVTATTNETVEVTTTIVPSTTTGSTTIEMNPPLLSNHRFSHAAMFEANERPPDPLSVLATPEDLHRQVDILLQWWDNKEKVVCLTGAGISTESGIPDYRGHTGSYHVGHKPMIHDHFMKSKQARQRYWGRGMVGWRFVDEKQPAAGHYALTQLESCNKLGVTFDDRPDYYANESDVLTGSGQQKLSLITQNVDSLHRRAGTQYMLELHGRNDRLHCMNCGYQISRTAFHDELEQLNNDWLNDALSIAKSSDMRADGDASVLMNYEEVVVPACRNCGNGFFKPDVVFFGDNVPPHRVKLFQAAVDNCDGLLVVGSSLAVHSAFRHVKSAHKQGIPVAILNVGETRAEIEQLNVLKIEAPAGLTLKQLANIFTKGER
jgi:NAD+-dependent protein deacetylase sirtuin 4